MIKCLLRCWSRLAYVRSRTSKWPGVRTLEISLCECYSGTFQREKGADDEGKLSDVYDEYLTFMRSMGLADNTIGNVQGGMVATVREYGDMRVNSITTADISAYFLETSKARSPSSWRTFTRLLARFFRYCVETVLREAIRQPLCRPRRPKADEVRTCCASPSTASREPLELGGKQLPRDGDRRPSASTPAARSGDGTAAGQGHRPGAATSRSAPQVAPAGLPADLGRP